MIKIEDPISLSLSLGVKTEVLQDLIYFSEYAENPASRELHVGKNKHIYSQTRQSKEKISNKIINIVSRNMNTKKFLNPESEIKEIIECAKSSFFKIIKNSTLNPVIKPIAEKYLKQLAEQLQGASDSYAKIPLQSWILETLNHWAIPHALHFRPLSPKQEQSLQGDRIKTLLELGFSSVSSEDPVNKAISVAVSPHNSFKNDIEKLLGQNPSEKTLETAARIVCEFYKTVLEGKIASKHKQTIINSLSIYALQAEQAISEKKGGKVLDTVFSAAGISLPSAALKPSQPQSAPALH